MSSIKLPIFVLFIIGCLEAASQPAPAQKLLPNILGRSPEAAGFSKFGNYQVNMFTGIPEISIPLYEIEVGELKVPIVLNYHASGLKIKETPSWVGLGWSLSAGGAINRKMMGKPDEQEGGYLKSQTVRQTSSLSTSNASDLDYLAQVKNGLIDVEPDIFSYSFPGKSGKFLFNQKNNYEPIFMPYDNVRVAQTNVTASSMMFDITDERGVTYSYATPEWTDNNGTTIAISTWMLSKMISANRQDTVTFNYTPRTSSGTTDSWTEEYLVLNDLVNTIDYSNPYTADYGTLYNRSGYSNTTWQTPVTIFFKGGKVVFEQATENREDFNYSGQSIQKRLKTIKVYSYDALTGNYKLNKTIRLYHNYYMAGSDLNTKRLRLDSVHIAGSDEVAVQKYSFDYNNSLALPSKDSKAIDYWGYYNGANNSTLIPSMTVDYQATTTTGSTTTTIGTANRESNSSFMQASILTKITFPTGGYTQFEYETNRYLDNSNALKYAGGLRVSKIKNYTSSTATPLVKTYKYGTGESGNGRDNFKLNNYFFQSTYTSTYYKTTNCICPCKQGSKRVRTFYSNPTIDIEPYDGSPVVYPTVTEYIGDEINNLGRTIYTFNDQPDGMSTVAAYGKPIITSYHFNRGQLKIKEVQRRNDDGSYVPVTKTINDYNTSNFSEQWNAYLGLVVFKQNNLENENGTADLGPASSGCADYHDSYSYQYGNYSIRTDDNKLTGTTEIVYDQKDASKTLTTTTSYGYNNIKHLQVTEVQSSNSKGESISTVNKYPHDFVTTGNVYETMVQKNIIDKLVEKTDFKSNVQLNDQKTNYASLSAINFLPQNVQFQVKSNPVETRAFFNNYDVQGNILEMQKSQDVKQSFIWDYQKLRPVAQVINASVSDIAYTSFESDGSGNWSGINQLKIVSNAYLTGSRSYYGSSFSFSKAGLNSASTYIVSYWSRSGAYSINGTKANFPQILRTVTINGQAWTLYEHQVSGQATITVTGSGSIDELRLYPLGAQMTTMSYEPLIGINTNCDINNKVTYYSYDNFGRLILVEDDSKKILNKYCYNYSGLQEQCKIFKSAAKTGTFTKTDCGQYYTGDVVTYTVPSGIYYSSLSQEDADNKALADVNNNGPNYANQNGSCTYSGTPISVQGYNTYSYNYNLRLSNNATNQQYVFTLPANTYGYQIIGQVPSGQYTVTFYPAGTPITANFYFNGTTGAGSGITFYNININSTSYAAMY